MFQRILRKERRAPTVALVAYLERLFLDPPHADPDITSYVYTRGDGKVSGFIGVLPQPFLVGGKPVRGAVCGSFMVDGHQEDPFAGARLLRKMLSGPQEISLTETANHISTGMWRKLHGSVLPNYSLEWLRIIRPAGFLAEVTAGAVAAARILKPLAWPADALIRRGSANMRWSRVPAAGLTGKVLASTEADDEQTAHLIRQFTESYAVRPQWQPRALDRMVAETRIKSLYGGTVRRLVLRGGQPVGLFLYFGDAGRVGRAVQVLSAPGQAGAVIDSMVADAADRGLVALRGRTRPDLLDAMMGRRFAFIHTSSTIVHTRNPELMEAIGQGRAFLNGFAGESWSRLIGDDFSAPVEGTLEDAA